jgi:hypothetical protein
MKAIRQYVEMGIPTVSDLKDALQLAMQLEFSTIPPYLCAQWSIREDPDRVEGILHKVVSQEMFHFALAGNLLTAIGGQPNIAHSEFVPRYPLSALPGGISQKMAVDLRPLTRRQIAVFMQIEYPEFPPITVAMAKRPATIGAFYSAIAEAFQKVQPTIYTNAPWIEVPFARRIHSTADAIATIDRIKSEGEGLEDSPEEPVADHSYAHYYLFKEIYVGRRLIRVGSNWKFEGNSIQMPKVFDFNRCMLRRERCVPFREALSQLLIDLQECWTRDRAVNVPAMFELQILGRKLIETGIRPEFTWAPGTRVNAAL